MTDLRNQAPATLHSTTASAAQPSQLAARQHALSHPPPEHAGPSRKVVAATVAGNALEFYDFVTYAFFAVYIGRTFFPATDALTTLLLSVAVFGVGFVSRPLGGVLIGAYADRVGRRPAMLLTIALITVGTLGLAITPGYAQIGVAAPVIVVLCRLVQGLALGGEVGPSTAFLIEAAPPGRRGLFGSWQLGSQGLATLVAGLLGMGLSASLSQEQLQSWGWRLPFALGLLLIPLAIYLRRAMPETQQQHAEVSNASWANLRRHGRLILLAMLVVLGGTVATYVSNYMTTFAITTLQLPATTAMAATVIVGLMTFVFALLGGWLCDRWGRKALMIWPRLLASLIAYPAFLWMAERGDAIALLITSALLAALGALSGAASLVAIPELLPGRIRALGMSVIYAVGVAIFGGSTQFVITWLIAVSGSAAAPALYLTATGLLAVLGMALMPEGRGRKLEH
ncbi:putative MFS family arabinose efflux permease [Aquitalea magnusonii]|uniref:Putative MFS family arabinose efflux permease n=1 Tax=Aquitalea magnusonii TaxID=332411 RepID=A0A318J646_9NEIS|nr:putative MFS family arabinose efflux permease [Aquitalea magnusonii]